MSPIPPRASERPGLGVVFPDLVEEPLGVLAADDELDGLLRLGAHDGVDEHGRTLASGPHRDHTGTAFSGVYGRGDMPVCRDSA